MRGGNDYCEITPSFESEKSHPRCVDKLTNSKYDPPPRNELARVFNVPHTFIHYHITHMSLTISSLIQLFNPTDRVKLPPLPSGLLPSLIPSSVNVNPLSLRLHVSWPNRFKRSLSPWVITWTCKFMPVSEVLPYVMTSAHSREVCMSWLVLQVVSTI